jgi:putative transcriptional regulator
VTNNIFLGGDFTSAVKNIDNHTLTEKDCKVFLGYCGWDYRELDNEITEGSWEVLETGNVFFTTQ